MRLRKDPPPPQRYQELQELQPPYPPPVPTSPPPTSPPNMWHDIPSEFTRIRCEITVHIGRPDGTESEVTETYLLSGYGGSGEFEAQCADGAIFGARDLIVRRLRPWTGD